jgi:hypothetical protein
MGGYSPELDKLSTCYQGLLLAESRSSRRVIECQLSRKPTLRIEFSGARDDPNEILIKIWISAYFLLTQLKLGASRVSPLPS